MIMFAVLQPPNSPSLLLQLLLCCSATAYMTRIPLQSSIHPPCSNLFLTSRMCNRDNMKQAPHHHFINKNRRRIFPSRYIPLAAASQKLGDDIILTPTPSDTSQQNGSSEKYGGQIDRPKQLDDDDAFQLLIQKAVRTLVMSDTDGDEATHAYGSASQGLWLHTPAAKEMQGVLDKVVLKVCVNNIFFQCIV